jgi:hypothetical protein
MSDLEELKSTINDLTLTLEMWLENYPFDEDHKEKQRKLIDRSCKQIGKPRNIEELKDMFDE